MITTDSFTVLQLCLSTAEEDDNYFTGSWQIPQSGRLGVTLPPGNYRIMDGILYRIVNRPTVLSRNPVSNVQMY